MIKLNEPITCIPRGAPIKNADFFYLKNFDRKFRFWKNLVVSVGLVCFHLAKRYYALFYACLLVLFDFTVLLACDLEFAFWSVVLHAVLIEKFQNY